MNYLNSRSPSAPFNGNFFNTPVEEDPGFTPDEMGNLFNRLRPAARESMAPMLYSNADGGGFDDGMSAFRPGEVHEAPVQRQENQPDPRDDATGMPAVRDQGSEGGVAVAPNTDDATQAEREDKLEELPLFVSVGGEEFLPYLKTMTGASDKETAEIAAAQYPGSKVRVGKNGRQIITMPPNATRGVIRPEPIGGREYLINAPGVSFRDIANGGTQEAAKLIAARGATIAAKTPIGAVLSGLATYVGLDQLLDREALAHRFGSKTP